MPSNAANTFVWVHRDQAAKLREMARLHADLEYSWLLDQRATLGLGDDEPTPEHIRIEMMALRPDNWPGESLMVAAAMRRRMAAEPLAGYWEPFTPQERAAQRLPGRRTGTPDERFGDKLALDLPVDLVDSAQLAAYRLSEPIVAALRAEHLVGPDRSRSKKATARRLELQAQIWTLGRVIRESITMIVGP
ncbi:hypothetical protein [Streptomyces sp. NRRL WC-3742]|uniref:hypothetical protein n=1 Tax=Streptomyces sp. NRRL WC-3742 TaxID=1463934 RepID=UPI0004C50DDB|nr:hypothetical protein [Streptomyces sp. NRRL WC-3742]